MNRGKKKQRLCDVEIKVIKEVTFGEFRKGRTHEMFKIKAR